MEGSLNRWHSFISKILWAIYCIRDVSVRRHKIMQTGTYIVITVQKNQESTAGGGHHQQPAVCKTIRFEFASSIEGSDIVHLLVRVSVKDAEIEITTSIVNLPVITIGIEDAMNDKVCEGEKERRNAIRVRGEFVALEKSIKDEVGVRKCCRWSEVCRGNGARVWRASFSDAGN